MLVRKKAIGILVLPLLVLLVLTAAVPLTALAQRSNDQPIWLAGAHLEGVSRDTGSGYDFYVNGNLEIVSRSGPVAGVLVQVVLTGPAGEQIHTEAVTARDGVAVIETAVPGPGNYGSTLFDMHKDSYAYDPNQNHVPIPTFVLDPPDGVVALIENGQLDRVSWFKPGTFTSTAKEIASWSITGSDFLQMEAIATDSSGYVYIGSEWIYDLCNVDKYTWYGVQVSSYQSPIMSCPEARGKRIALATTLQNELVIARHGPDLTIAVDRYNAGGSQIASWIVDVPLDFDIPYTLNGRAFDDITVDSQNRVYIGFVSGNIYTSPHRGVVVTTNTGAPLHLLDTFGLPPEQSLWPGGIDVDPNGNIYVGAPLYDNEVKRLNIVNGTLAVTGIWQIAHQGWGESIDYLAVDANGRVFVGEQSWLEVYAGPASPTGWQLAGLIDGQYTPGYTNVVAIDVTP